MNGPETVAYAPGVAVERTLQIGPNIVAMPYPSQGWIVPCVHGVAAQVFAAADFGGLSLVTGPGSGIYMSMDATALRSMAASLFAAADRLDQKAGVQ